MTAAYPPVGTRVRWTSSGRTREGVVVLLVDYRQWQRGKARGECAFLPSEVWRRHADDRGSVLVVDVDTVDGKPRTGARRYYHPRPQWLEIVETPTCG